MDEQQPVSVSKAPLPDDELRRLADRIDRDFLSAISEHEQRIKRYDSYLKIWRQLCDDAIAKGDSAFSVPMMEWHVWGKVAQVVSMLLGNDAEVVAVPVGPSDNRIVHKVARFTHWRVFNYMGATIAMICWIWLALFYGRAIAYRPWRKDEREIPGEAVETDYDGPDLVPLDPNDIVLPADNATNVHSAAWVIRRTWMRPDQLLEQAEKGVYFNIEDDFESIVQYSRGGPLRDGVADTLRETQDRAEGVNKYNQSQGEQLAVQQWFGRWRMLKPDPKSETGFLDGDEWDLSVRDHRETEVVVTYIPIMKKVIGFARLVDLYPKMRRRRPFSEISMAMDGSAWPKGLGETLYNLQNSLDGNHRLIDKITRITAMPPVFFDPADGFDPQTTQLDAGLAIPCANPQNVNQLKVGANVQPLLEREQMMLGYAERLSRVTEQNLGRSQPNVTTASGQLALIEQSNIGVSLDGTILRHYLGQFFQDIWELDCCYPPDPEDPDKQARLFFRVTEEDSKGLFPVSQGGAYITDEERAGRYDFSIKFATSVWSKQARKQEAIQVYQLSMANPLVATNPKALWVAGHNLYKALDAGEFSELVPEPPDVDSPRRPEQEWALVLQGEPIQVHPMDHDDRHLQDHIMRIATEQRAKQPDTEAINAMIAHVVDHQAQKKEKALMQATVQALAGPGGILEQATGGPMGAMQQQQGAEGVMPQ